MYYVYIIQSSLNSRYYVGSTRNIDRRLEEHNSGKNKSTKGRGPYIVVYYEEFLTLGGARKREAQIKSYKGGQGLKKLLGKI